MEVPTDKPELISYESYWQTIKKNSALRPDANIKEVLRVTDVLESRVQQSFTRPAYKGMALRVINALAVAVGVAAVLAAIVAIRIYAFVPGLGA